MAEWLREVHKIMDFFVGAGSIPPTAEFFCLIEKNFFEEIYTLTLFLLAFLSIQNFFWCYWELAGKNGLTRFFRQATSSTKKNSK